MVGRLGRQVRQDRVLLLPSVERRLGLVVGCGGLEDAYLVIVMVHGVALW